ncbi:MAG: CTP synthase [Candidatus Phytoplasma asteris]|uniref:CTP synthase n=7 Tax=16SrI (Aster yellows group) TaxID=3042590 RepID=PYRG_ONYPE|nr:RecName: Full=CTP synthase; AltName: Full=Cytidine 5'-triphosphate synthase; AltName: Full=Cytidine triphosphate synthetase; Short=CTP synthetase; Short=CTPS; AltName: Full=UTP--ammonia ligase [Onion yellows phytoplasma OY-M]TKA88059.1 MAG: CTP synthase [Periwinkle leaf yellowing phytoplasma]WEX19559.1 MAG: CTP synthase [Candidatus Phytoplasma asteris]BAD04696.1 CTP synthase [Onion yellows phytoplasma OY-M]
MNNKDLKTKFIFITGGVVSSLGKGITAASIGQILKNRGLKVSIQKLDPYINIDPGTMSPYQHGEVFVTDDGAETDLDLGHYERFLDENMSKKSNVTAGQIYQSVINKEREGKYLGKTVQVIPHITEEIKQKLIDVALFHKSDVVIVEIGGTVGDIESSPFLEAIRQVRFDFGYHNVLYLHTTLVPYLKKAQEIKTKPTQHSVKELRALGIQPQILVLRSEVPINPETKNKIAALCDINPQAIFEALDVDILYQMILNLHHQGIDDFILQHFKLTNFSNADLQSWKQLITRIQNLEKKVVIALVGKYIVLHDAYLSIIEALKHASYQYNCKLEIKWIDAEKVTPDNISSLLEDYDGILVPYGFGNRAIEGKILAINYARTNNIPFFGICLGMQLAVIEYARNVLHLQGANSLEVDEKTPHPVITKKIVDSNLGGTLRLGSYPCHLKANTKSKAIYNQEIIYERHRHRFEMNPHYVALFEKNNDFVVSGINQEQKLCEIVELKSHPWFIAVQFHPEFLSRPLKPHPLFKGFVEASLLNQKNK